MQSLSTEIKELIFRHLNADINQLLLTSHRYPGIDMHFVADQIAARQQIKGKLPHWYENPDLIFPSRISTEQCSSEATALYKQSLLRGEKLCDLTGGLGIDSYYFSQKAKEVIYIERFPDYCSAATANFQTLHAKNIRIINADCREIISTLSADTFYIDPARRSGQNKRVFALSECEPDILQLKPILLAHSRRVIVKISPMADISETLRLLPETAEIHILAVKNECKELLFILEPNPGSPVLHAVNLTLQGQAEHFSFTEKEEKEAGLRLASSLRKFLFEPNAAVMKSGAFKLIANRFQLEKLHPHSHLYTSDSPCPEFPGRRFRVNRTFAFSGKLLKQLKNQFPKANLTTRNFLLSVEELRKRSKIKEGGETYLFATTIGNNQPVIIDCQKCIPENPD